MHLNIASRVKQPSYNRESCHELISIHQMGWRRRVAAVYVVCIAQFAIYYRYLFHGLDYMHINVAMGESSPDFRLSGMFFLTLPCLLNACMCLSIEHVLKVSMAYT